MSRIERVSSCALAMMLTLLTAGNALSSDQRLVTDDGREVLLRPDGSWIFLSNDRFANTEDGQRVRLKQDGSWEYVGKAPMVTPARVRTTELDIRIQNAVIEIHERKVQKNTRVNSQTVFQVKLDLSPTAKQAISIDEKDVSLINITDNKGRDYPVLSLHPASAMLDPNSQMVVTIRVDGSPQWWKNVRSMNIVFSPGIFGIKDPISLRKYVDEIEKKKVDGFEES